MIRYIDAEEIFSTRAKGRNYKVLDREGYRSCYLRYDAEGDRYILQHYSTDILAIHRGHYQLLSMWNSMSTRRHQSEAMGVGVRADSKRSHGCSTFVNGHPAFKGMRIWYSGHVFEEDIRPLKRKVANPQKDKAWRVVRKRIAAQALGRTALGEVGAVVPRPIPQDLYDIACAAECDPEYLLTSEALGAMQCYNTRYIPDGLSTGDRLAGVRAALTLMREHFLSRNEGYDVVEVQP